MQNLPTLCMPSATRSSGVQNQSAGRKGLQQKAGVGRKCAGCPRPFSNLSQMRAGSALRRGPPRKNLKYESVISDFHPGFKRQKAAGRMKARSRPHQRRIRSLRRNAVPRTSACRPSVMRRPSGEQHPTLQLGSVGLVQKLSVLRSKRSSALADLAVNPNQLTLYQREDRERARSSQIF